VTNAGLTCGRAVRATWLMLAKGTGSTARSVGRARDIDPGHRRDGIALALLGLAVVIAASSWFDAARPVGAWVDSVLRIFIGSAVVVLPVVTAGVAVLLMRTEPNPDARPRLVLGATMVALPVLGLWHLWAGSPDTPVGRAHAAGFIGFAIGGPLSEGLTAWICAPLLFIGALFGLLLLTGTTIREVPDTLRSMFGTRMFGYGESERECYEDDPDIESPVAEDFSDGYYDDPSAYGGDEAQAWPSGTSPVGADDSPTVPELALTRGRRRGAKSVAKQDTLVLDRVVEGPYTLPSLSLLVAGDPPKKRSAANDHMADSITSVLEQFKVDAAVTGCTRGPTVTRYEVELGPGVKVEKITALQRNIAYAVATESVRMLAPIPGKSAVGIEVPNKSAALVTIREVIETAAFREGSNKLALGLGNDVSGQSIVADLTRMPHLLIAGATGQGKSVCINALITSLLFQVTPDHLRLLLIDPKRVELTGYNGLPHLALPVLVESHQAAAALRWAVAEMDRRYKLFSAEGVRNIAAYNDKAALKLARTLPYVVIVIDELADLMMVAAGEIEELICRIAQLARAVGIHLIIATQRPSTDIITGLIKANIPSRIAFAVGSQVDSRVILDAGGAEKLLGRGDMLYQPVDAGKPTRIQGAFVSDPEVEGVVNFWKSQGGPRYMEEILEEGAGIEWDGERREERKLDPLFARAARAVAAEGAASVSLVQRKFNVGYSRAGRIVDQLAEHRVVGGYQGSKSREVLMTLPDVDDLLERLGLE
jgi:S-DNA-T family DNA segregation ATPase FtsK/SpoIIIE